MKYNPRKPQKLGAETRGGAGGAGGNQPTQQDVGEVPGVWGEAGTRRWLSDMSELRVECVFGMMRIML
jgi:hypothetical protein